MPSKAKQEKESRDEISRTKKKLHIHTLYQHSILLEKVENFTVTTVVVKL